jgi:hypothetical protein
MPRMNLDVVDAAELAELLQFLTGWITSDPARFTFTFLLGGNDGEPLFQPGPLSALHPTIRPALPLQPVTRKPGRRPNTPRTNTSVHQSLATTGRHGGPRRRRRQSRLRNREPLATIRACWIPTSCWMRMPAKS